MRFPRFVALPLALTVALANTALPMCASLRAQVAEPCAMHDHSTGHAGHGPQIVAGHAAHDACHGHDGALGCAAGGSCPTSGVAAPFAAAPLLTTPDLMRDVMSAIDRAYRSFLSPPPPPPPQA